MTHSQHQETPSSRDLFEVLLREHAAMLRVYLRSLVSDPGLADDLFQETALVAWRRLGDFDRTRPFGPWLRGIGRVLAMNATSKLGKHQARPLDPEIVEAHCASIESRRGDTFDDRSEDIRACVDRLPEPSAEIVRAYYWGGVTLNQLAGGEESMAERLKKRLQRARALIVDCLEQKGWFGSPAPEATP